MPRKPLELLHRRLTEEERSRRLRDENPLFEAGEPPRVEGLPRNIRRWWNKYASGLLKKGWLARSDGDVLLAMAQAGADGDDDEVIRLLDGFKTRGKVPLPQAPAQKEIPDVSVPPVDVTAEARRYAEDVLAGNIIAGALVNKACKRFLDDLTRDTFTYDPTAAQRVADYVAFLGVRLMGWQSFVVANLYGFKKPNGLRRFTLCYVELGKKNGKSTLMSALGLYMADPEGDGEENGHVYCAATTKAQSADIVFQSAKNLCETSPALQERTERYMMEIAFENGGKFAPLAANSDKLNGLNIHFGILDELGDHPDSSLFSVFKSSQVSRKQPILCAITTAGHTRENPAWYLREHACQVLDGVITDDEFFCYIAALDPEDKWDSEECWIKANPSLGVTVQLDRLRSDCAQAKSIRSLKASFVRFNLNRWPSTTSSPWIDANDLDKPGCAFIFPSESKILDVTERLAAVEKRLLGKRCFGGLDLAPVNDLSVFCLMFPPWDFKAEDSWTEDAEQRVHDDGFEILFKVYCPAENIEERSRVHRVPYTEWEEKKLITATPGNTTDFSFIEHDIEEAYEKFNIEEIGFDVAGARDIAGRLSGHGFKMTQIRQGFGLSPAILRIEKLVKECKFCAHGNPIALWNFSNVVLSKGVRDLRLDKNKSREKIDCAAAACCAFDVYLAAEQLSSGGCYTI
jgi:phage terminase large subunit-like protein